MALNQKELKEIKRFKQVLDREVHFSGTREVLLREFIFQSFPNQLEKATSGQTENFAKWDYVTKIMKEVQ